MTIIRELILFLESSQAAVGLFIAAVGGAFSFWYSRHQRRLARRERAADLFDRFYSLENYHAMVAPVYVITLKWNAHRRAGRTGYAEALCRGWAGPEHAERLISAWDPEYGIESAQRGVDLFEEAHFRRSHDTDGVTAHAALTAFLYFWVKLDAMVEAGLVSRRLTKRLFRQPYGIYAPFIADFRAAVLSHPHTANGDPAWIDATRNLEGLLLEERPRPDPIDWGPALVAHESANMADAPRETADTTGEREDEPSTP